MHVCVAKWPHQGPPQRADMAETAQNPADIAGQGPNISPLATLRLEHGLAVLSMFHEVYFGNLDRPGLQFDGFAGPRQIIGAFALDLDRGILRRDLLDQAGEVRRAGAGAAAPQATS